MKNQEIINKTKNIINNFADKVYLLSGSEGEWYYLDANYENILLVNDKMSYPYSDHFKVYAKKYCMIICKSELVLNIMISNSIYEYRSGTRHPKNIEAYKIPEEFVKSMIEVSNFI